MHRPPLSVRHDKAALERYREDLHEGVTPWMHQGVLVWAEQFFLTGEKLRRAEQALRIQLDWSNYLAPSSVFGVIEDPGAVRASLLDNLRDPVIGLDLLDYCLGLCVVARSDEFFDSDTAQDLEVILARSGSAWTVGRYSDGRRYCLEKRVDPTVEGAARREMKQQSNAAEYLRSAWHHVYGRNRNPSIAYLDAVRAVEAAARPVVTPTDDRTTLGKMISALQDKPQKWGTVIGDVETVRQMMETIWKSHRDRHGTDDTTTPLNVSQAEAEAAVQIGVTLVHLFRSGAIQRIS